MDDVSEISSNLSIKFHLQEIKHLKYELLLIDVGIRRKGSKRAINKRIQTVRDEIREIKTLKAKTKTQDSTNKQE